MDLLEIDNIGLRLNADFAISDFSLSVTANEIMVILGPSGCGKTTLLRLIAGFESVEAGRVCIDGAEVSRPSKTVAPFKRNVGMVFQQLALWPHKTAYENVVISLRGLKMSRGEKRARAIGFLKRVGLNGQRDRFPSELSAGEQQRVALARSLIREPRLVLLDEPFSNLDPELTGRLCRMIADLRAQFGLTIVFVTHDRSEAFQMADRIAIMRSGQILQVGTLDELRRKPTNDFVAQYVH